MVTQELTPEEQQCLEKFRADKIAHEKHLAKQAFLKQREPEIEAKFLEALATFHQEAGNYQERFQVEIQKVIDLSEKYHIPFGIKVPGLSAIEQYTPAHLQQIWEGLPYKVYRENNLSCFYAYETGRFDYWDPSSLKDC